MNTAQTCTVDNKYLSIQQSYSVTLNLLDSMGNSVDSRAATVLTPLVPNPAPV